MKRIITIVALLALTAPFASGTAVVILANSGGIVVAADTKVFGSHEKICKIFKIGSMYWAMSGVMDNSVVGYDVARIVKNSYVPGRKVAKVLTIFMQNVASPLQELIVHAHKFPDMFAKVRYDPLEIAFWEFEDGKPVIAHVFYTTIVDGNRVSIKITEKEVTDCCVPNQNDSVFLGVRNRAHDFAVSNPRWPDNLMDSANIFIDLSVQEASEDVGPPVSTLLILPDGSYHWIGPHEYCDDELKERPPPEPTIEPKPKTQSAPKTAPAPL